MTARARIGPLLSCDQGRTGRGGRGGLGGLGRRQKGEEINKTNEITVIRNETAVILYLLLRLDVSASGPGVLSQFGR